MPAIQSNNSLPVRQKCWVAVASAEHVRIGRAEGFMQVCHGKGAPLRRVAGGDWVVYYSPTDMFGGRDRLQAFTAIGVALSGDPYRADMGGGFHPFRRNVRWISATETPIRPLLDQLSFCADKNWGYQLRFGLFEIERRDMRTIARAMGASVLPLDELVVDTARFAAREPVAMI